MPYITLKETDSYIQLLLIWYGRGHWSVKCHSKAGHNNKLINQRNLKSCLFLFKCMVWLHSYEDCRYPSSFLTNFFIMNFQIFTSIFCSITHHDKHFLCFIIFYIFFDDIREGVTIFKNILTTKQLQNLQRIYTEVVFLYLWIQRSTKHKEYLLNIVSSAFQFIIPNFLT